MAKNQTIKVIVDAENNTSRAFSAVQKNLEQLESNTSKFGDKIAALQPTFQKMAVGGAAAFAAITGGALSLAKAAAMNERTEITFNRLTKTIGGTPEAINDLREATRGLVDDATLMQSGNRLIQMGLAQNTEEMSRLSEMAVTLGGAMGNEATASMEAFALMLANQSLPRLDTFGISSGKVRNRIAELQAETAGMTRETAFMQAVMEQGEASMAKLGEQSATTGETYQQTMVRIRNLRQEVGEALIPILADLLEAVTPVIKSVANFAQENPALIRTLVKVTAAISGAVAVLGTMGIAVFQVTNKVGLLGNAISGVHKIVSGFSKLFLAGGLASIGLTALVAAIVFIIVKLNEFGKEVGGIKNAWLLTVLQMEIKFWNFVKTVVAGLDTIFSKIPGLGSVFGETLDTINSKIATAEGNFDALAVQGIGQATAKGSEFADVMSGALGQVTADLDMAAGVGGEMASKMDDSFQQVVNSVIEIRDEIKTTYQEITDAINEFRENTKSEEQSYQDKVVDLVANAKEKIRDLESQLEDERDSDSRAGVERIRKSIEEQEEIIRSYKKSGLELDEEISEQRKFLNMNEFEQITFTHNQKLEQMKTEFMRDQIYKLAKLALLKREHQNILNTIDAEKRAMIEAEYQKQKTYRERLRDQKLGLNSWMNETQNMYSRYVERVNEILSRIKEPSGRVTGRRAAGGSVSSSQPYMVGEKGAEMFVPNSYGRIVPNNQLGMGGGLTVVIQGNTFADEDEMAEKVGDKIVRLVQDNMRV